MNTAKRRKTFYCIHCCQASVKQVNNLNFQSIPRFLTPGCCIIGFAEGIEHLSQTGTIAIVFVYAVMRILIFYEQFETNCYVRTSRDLSIYPQLY